MEETARRQKSEGKLRTRVESRWVLGGLESGPCISHPGTPDSYLTKQAMIYFEHPRRSNPLKDKAAADHPGR